MVIESPCELDVVAVYTVATPSPAGGIGNVVAFATERVPARRIASCRDDLKLDLSTGVAPWTLVSGPGLIGVPRLATVIEDANRQIGTPPTTWGTQPGAKWIGVRDMGNVLLPPGQYTYQICFNLCAGFENARIDLSILADNSAQIFLNNDPGSMLSMVGFTNADVKSFSFTQQNLFLPGQNCLTIVVTNLPTAPNPNNPTGLNVRVAASAVRGLCPDCGCC